MKLIKAIVEPQMAERAINALSGLEGLHYVAVSQVTCMRLPRRPTSKVLPYFLNILSKYSRLRWLRMALCSAVACFSPKMGSHGMAWGAGLQPLERRLRNTITWKAMK